MGTGVADQNPCSTRSGRWSGVPRKSTELSLLLDNTWFKSRRQFRVTPGGGRAEEARAAGRGGTVLGELRVAAPPANGRKRQGRERAFDFLTKRHQPDQGGTHEGSCVSRTPTTGQWLPFGTPPRRIVWDSDAGRAGRRLRQDRTSSVRCAGRICDANAITWRPCGTAVSAPICPPPPG